MRLITWNVLHRIHAVNWDEPVIAKHPDEHARIAAIAAWIAERIERCDADVICLQEVGHDQLVALEDLGAVCAMRYPRVPKYSRRSEPATLTDPGEHLVILARGKPVLASSGAFASDPGKGFLIADVDGVLVATTHVTHRRHAEQCPRILEELGDAAAIICGDFNADRATCAECLPGFAPAIPREPALPTRPRQHDTEKSQTIDHVFGRGVRIVEAEVLDAGGLSDHNPVRVRIER
jgi:endonuclease/exonuclease/phosphatase family metal-dependent hydrolase